MATTQDTGMIWEAAQATLTVSYGMTDYGAQRMLEDAWSEGTSEDLAVRVTRVGNICNYPKQFEVTARSRSAGEDAAEMVPCTTCDGQGQGMMRGEAHRDYDEPDYMDTCGICGGAGELPASMFSENDADEPEDDEWDED